MRLSEQKGWDMGHMVMVRAARSGKDGVMQHQRIASLRRPPIGFAHRGARAHADDNTLPAFTLALRLGATGLETDAVCTADGAVVLDHDGKVRGRVRSRRISSLTRESLPPHIPTIDDLYDHCGTDFELSVDVKDPSVVRPLLAAARRHGAETRLWVCHPDVELLSTWRDHTSARLVCSTRLSAIREGPERRAAVLTERGIDAINMHHSDWTGGLTTLFHRFDRFCLAWDAQHERVIEDLVRMGLDGIYGDHVDRLMSAISAQD